jgi:uncharacterized protein YdbL (DUF1318 family)
MTLIALAMNALLAGLLIAALGLGVRLDRKLKGVRENQAAFAAAVHDLNAAAAKAQKALADLREATDEATEHLGGRIARAREVGERLEKNIARAEAVPARREGPEGGLNALINVLKEQDEVQPTPRIIRPPERPVERYAERPTERPQVRPARPKFDDDLFEDVGGRA